ncbi:hypothetical protein [Caballeronia sordidicola]|jgi:hypothetical protein|uniref:Uncharacterized protein n=1 Tax=Caballeronia sordidicola TaxID=196367 RepID=A0A226X6G8_CABSO|nr:hypothetical protein [Caballeronia sordidicola]OXC78933.1 hypothetical protein BSU04_09770 [Caballeronia sordidicola]
MEIDLSSSPSAVNTYVLYGDDAAHKTWGNVTWKRTRRHSYGGVPILEPTLGNPLSAKAPWNPGTVNK